MKISKKITSSPDAAVFLRELYDVRFIKRDSKFDTLYNSNINTEEENCLRSVLFREEEDPIICSEYKLLVHEFKILEIYKKFGISLIDYFNLTRQEKKIITDIALKDIQENNSISDQIQKESKMSSKTMDKINNKILKDLD